MSLPSKDEILRDLIEFFLESFSEDTMGVADWLAQGDWDVDEFYDGVKKLKKELALRD